jgi:hypothetical protein
MPSAVGRDPQVSDVPLRGGSRRHWTGTAAWTGALAGSMLTKSHTYPVSGGAALRHLMLEASVVVLGVGVWIAL